MHVVECMYEIQPIQHTHQGEDKKQVQLGLNMYFGKLMRMTTSTHLKINTDTMHQCIAVLAAPKKTMHMLADELDGGSIPMHPDTMEARVRFSKMSPLITQTPSRTTKLGISSPHSPSQGC